MSHIATNWAFSQRQLKPGPKLTLLCLADRHNADMGCFPSQETLAEDACVSRSTLNDHLDLLEAQGLIRRERRVNSRTKRQKSTRYILGFEPEFSQDADDPSPETGHGTDEEQAPDAESGNRTRAVSGKRAEPCPDFPPSRVRNPDSNPVREPVNEPDAQAQAPAREGGGGYDFEDFWAAYPNRVDRDAAERAWLWALAQGANPARLVVKARRYAATDKVARGYAKTPANWLRDGGWRDPQPGDAPDPGAPPEACDLARFWADRIASGRTAGAAACISTALAQEMVGRGLIEAETLKALGVAT